MNKPYKKVHPIDARNINSIITEKIVDVTITSPPYFDLKDYGYKNQIGFGQNYEDYLKDLKIVFEQVFNCTKDTGTLWVIIDAFRRDGEVIPLPFDFSNRIRQVGWKLQEVIIWGKDRTVPWAHKGQMRNLFEYILVFSKSDKYNFFINEVRETETLKKWWIRYPERYNPRGKTPDAIWHYDIPTQGSWGDGYIKHFCPLPEALIEQIIKLTTKEGDVVLDPFAGSGAVLAKADNMKRQFIGFELNHKYVEMFETYLSNTGSRKRAQYQKEITNTLKTDNFIALILNLRALKFGKLLLSKTEQQKGKKVRHILILKTKEKPKKPNALIKVQFFLLIDGNKEELLQYLTDLVNKPPLSKFGIESEINVVKTSASFMNAFQGRLYSYKKNVVHRFLNAISSTDKTRISDDDVIISNIKVDVDEKEYA